MPNIEIDFDVFKEITIRRASEHITHNDVLRELFKLKPKKGKKDFCATIGKPWVAKGVSFLHDTEFSAVYKGQKFDAIVNDGALVLNGKRFSSPSSAAVSITGNPVNGWIFWKCKLKGQQTWQIIEKFRNQIQNEKEKAYSSELDGCIKPETKAPGIVNILSAQFVTDNDIRAKILRIPKEIKPKIGKSKSIVLYLDETNKKVLNVDKTGTYIGGVTDIFRKCGLINEKEHSSPKISVWSEFEKGFMVKFINIEAVKSLLESEKVSHNTLSILEQNVEEE